MQINKIALLEGGTVNEYPGEQTTPYSQLKEPFQLESERLVEHSLFSTARLDKAPEKVEMWRDSTRFIFDVHPNNPGHASPFFAEIESFNFGSLVTSICKTVASSWQRSPADAACNGVDHFLIQFYLEGHCLFSDQERSALAKPGDILVLDATRKIHSKTSHLKNFTLWVPRTLLEPMISDPDALHGLIIAAEEPRAVILRTYLMSLHKQASDMTLSQASSLIRPTMELLASTLDLNHQQFATLPETAIEGSLVSIKRYINQHLNQDNLTPDSIAKSLCISRATLYRVCAPLGGIQQYIRQQRLQKVLNDLIDSHMQHLSITQIASLWGFNDASSFNRIFKREFGVSPSVVRNQKQHLTRNNYQASADELLVGDRHFAHWLTQQFR